MQLFNIINARKLGNKDFPWVVQANLSSSSNANARLLFQTEAEVVDGYAAFTKLGISEISTFSLTYSFKLPEGLNASRFDPKVVQTAPVEAGKPILACKQHETTVTAEENGYFNVTVVIVDKQTKNQIENISWAVSNLYLLSKNRGEL